MQALGGRRDSDPGSGRSKSVRFGQVTMAQNDAHSRAARNLPRLASSGRSVSGDFSDAQVCDTSMILSSPRANSSLGNCNDSPACGTSMEGPWQHIAMTGCATGWHCTGVTTQAA